MRPTIGRISRIDLPKRLVSGQEFNNYLADFDSRQKKGKYGERELDDYRPTIQVNRKILAKILLELLHSDSVRVEVDN